MPNKKKLLKITQNYSKLLKIKHDHQCQVCGKPATQNIQSWWHAYTIDADGNFHHVNNWAGDDNEFFCDDCN